ncbi:MAG: GPW/gp25 family protein [Lachnospiraceae bacterium]|nr:GPW/gp25 family protein [Lachnospiraceae bacterium]
MAKETFLGTGMKFPPQINKATGRFMTSSEGANVKESVYLILMTQKTERLARPEFGSSIMSYAFTDTNGTLLNLLSQEIAGDIQRGEPRIENVSVNIDAVTKEGCLMIYVDYTLSATHQRDSMVFPYYLNMEPEEESESYETMESNEIE